MSSRWTPEQLESARALIARESDWRRRNPGAYEIVERWALHEAESGRKMGMRAAVEQLRWKDRTDLEGNTMKIENGFASVWARRIMHEHPETVGFIEVHQSPIDEVMRDEW